MYPKELKGIFKSGESEQEKQSELVMERGEGEEDDEDSKDGDDVEKQHHEIEKVREKLKRHGFLIWSFLNDDGDEAREYVLKKRKQVLDDDDDEDDELGILELAGQEDDSEAEEITYHDFYTSNKKHDQNKSLDEEHQTRYRFVGIGLLISS